MEIRGHRSQPITKCPACHFGFPFPSVGKLKGEFVQLLYAQSSRDPARSTSSQVDRRCTPSDSREFGAWICGRGDALGNFLIFSLEQLRNRIAVAEDGPRAVLDVMHETRVLDAQGGIDAGRYVGR